MRLTNNCLIKVYYPVENQFKLIDIPCKIYGFLAIHRCHDNYGNYEYAITHLPTGLKLPVTGSKRALRQFCAIYGNNSMLWDVPWDAPNYIKKIKSKDFQNQLIQLFEESGLTFLYPGDRY